MAAKTKKLTATLAADKQSPTSIASEGLRQDWIATAAYYLAEARGFEPGFEMTDWCRAEQAYSAQMGGQ